MATDLQIRFCAMSDGARIAYATVGEGPALVWPPGWISHLERQWSQPAFRAFVETLGRHHTVVLFDRYGSGLSDRNRTEFSIAADVRAVEAVVDHLRLDRFALLGVSASGPYCITYALAQPYRVSHLILFGTRARVDAATLPLREAMNALIHADWGIGSRTLADIFIPDADAATNAWFAAWQREAATADMAIELRSMSTRTDVTDLAARLRLPTLVIHRRGDLVVTVDHGRDLAALIPGARFVLLEGRDHLPYFGDAAAVLRTVAAFLGDPIDPPLSDGTDQPAERGHPAPARPSPVLQVLASVDPAAANAGQDGRPDDPLTAREREVAIHIARGLSNRQIAETLVISERTAEVHVAHILNKLGFTSRAQVAVWAAQAGLFAAS